jgi:Fic family protein
MPIDAELLRRYAHIRFERHWAVDDDVCYLLGKCDSMVEAIARMPLQPEYRKQLLSVSLIKGAQATTAIEGNTLTENEVRQVAEGASLPPSKGYQEREVKNILDAMNTILDSTTLDGHAPLVSPDLICKFHRYVGQELGEHFDAIPGRFRRDARVVGPYKCPRHEDIEGLIEQLCDWLPRQFGFPSGKQTFQDAVLQAIVTHVYLEWIHPFGDGNGRTGRLLEFYILLRAGNPDIASHILSNFYNETRAEYYRQIDRANRDRDLTAFIRYAVQGYHDGLAKVIDAVSMSMFEVAWKYLVHHRFAEHPHRKTTVARRQRALALAIPPTLGGAAPSQLAVTTPELARQYAALSTRTLMRDLATLQEMELIVHEDGKYKLNFGLLVPHVAQRRMLKKQPAA